MEQIENAPQKKKVKKGCLIGAIVGIVFLVILIAVGIGGGDDSQEQGQKEKQTVAQAEKKKEAHKNPWVAFEEVDEMSNEVRYFKKTESLNELEFDFPYQGGSSFTLMVRGKENQKPEIILLTDNGQFMSSFGGSEHLRLKFDDGEAFTVTYNSSANGNANVIFLNSESKILKMLPTAKKLKIEAPFFESGCQIIDFDVEGFTWEH